jgi:hypothetical protein
MARSVHLSQFGAISSNTTGGGPGGNISVEVTGKGRGALTIQTAGEISAATSGNGGRINVDVAGGLMVDGADMNDRTGIDASAQPFCCNAGIVTVTARSISLRDGGEISAFTEGKGKAGGIEVHLTGELTIAGLSANLDFPTGILSSSSGRGPGGDVRVTAPRVLLADSGVIESDTAGRGRGGNVSVDVSGKGSGALTIWTGGEISASTQGLGDGGRITVDVAGGLTVNGFGFAGTGIFAGTGPLNRGNGGEVSVRARSLTLVRGGLISTSTQGPAMAAGSRSTWPAS